MILFWTVLISLLALLFSVGDLLGKDRVARVERAWLSFATRLAAPLRSHAQVIWPVGALTASAVPAVIAAAALLGSGLLAWNLLELPPGGASRRARFNFTALVVFVVLGLSYYLTSSLARRLTDSALRSPLELRIAFILCRPIALLDRALSTAEWGAGDHENPGEILVVPMIAAVLFLGPLIAAVLVFGLFLRLLVVTLASATWLVAFGPAKGLGEIARLTGVESWFDVGKYLVLLAGAILAVFAARK